MTTKNNGIYAPDGSQYVTITDGANNLAGFGVGGIPAGSAATTVSSGNVANASAVAAIPATAAKTNYIAGFMITGSGATAASVVSPTITGLAGGTVTLTLPVVAGATLGNVPLLLDIDPPMPASAVNTAITLTVPALGAGNTNSTAVIYGYTV